MTPPRSSTPFLDLLLEHSLLYREVRRAALLNLAPSQKSLTVILSRTRDVDTTLRKIVYHHVLSNLKPQLLSLAQREEVVSNGLGDREPSVRGAAAAMIGTWVDAKEGDLIEVGVLMFRLSSHN